MKNWQLWSALHVMVNMCVCGEEGGGVTYILRVCVTSYSGDLLLFCKNVFTDFAVCYWMDRFRDGIQKLFNILWFPMYVSQNIFTAVDTES